MNINKIINNFLPGKTNKPCISFLDFLDSLRIFVFNMFSQKEKTIKELRIIIPEELVCSSVLSS